VLGTRTDLNQISRSDLGALTVSNRRLTKLDEGKLASLLSQSVLNNFSVDQTN